MQAILAAKLSVKVAAVISNRQDAAGLEVAKKYQIPTVVVNHVGSDRETFDAMLASKIDEFKPDYIVLAGFMRILTAKFIDHFQGRIVNIHPSLLPSFTGLHTHRRALEEGVKIHGCTVHIVTAELDNGPIIIQAAVPVSPEDTEETLAVKVLEQEHRIYPAAIKWLCDGNVVIEHNRLLVKGAMNNQTALINPGIEK